MDQPPQTKKKGRKHKKKGERPMWAHLVLPLQVPVGRDERQRAMRLPCCFAGVVTQGGRGKKEEQCPTFVFTTAKQPCIRGPTLANQQQHTQHRYVGQGLD